MTAKTQTKVRLKEKYRKEVLPALMEKLGYKSVMEIPHIEKIVLNMCEPNDKKALEGAVSDMTKIAGQKPIITKARNSIAGFKIREGWPIGCKVTLRQDRMYEFLDRLISIYLPRVRDFRGLSVRSFDGRGNFSLGIKEQIICPEIDYDKIDQIRGFDIIIATSAKNNKDAYCLLKEFNFPFKDQIS